MHILFIDHTKCSEVFCFRKTSPPLVNCQFYHLRMSFLDDCAIVFTHCTLLYLLSSCTSYRQPSSLWFTSWLYRAVPLTVCWSGCLCLLPDVCPLVVIWRFIPTLHEHSDSSAATAHTTIILRPRSLRPVGFCPFLAGKCLHAVWCQNNDQKSHKLIRCVDRY